jgi:hypothetical protein
MNRPHDEPLSPEERALAERLSRLGPHDGPSPALDAKILAAAHAAVAASTPRRRRWLALSAVPGSVITGVGMAAALVLVVGVVWQMRPSGPAPQPAREEGANMGYVSAEILRRPQAQVAPPPPPPAEPARELRPALARRAAPAGAAPPAPAPADDTYYMDEAVATHAPALTQEAADAAAVAAAPAPPASPSPSAFSAPAESERFSAAAAGSERREAASIRQQAQAKRQASQREAMAVVKAPVDVDEVELTAARIQEAPPAGTAAAYAAPVASVPVDEDARLPPSQWLQRIRERRDAGDLDGARASLARFKQDHPRERVPRDLRKLATPGR